MANVVENAVNFVGDFVIIPGTSQILKGDYTSGLIHAGVGIASRALLANPIGLCIWVAAAANSYSRSVRERSLIDFGESDKEQVAEGLDVLLPILKKKPEDRSDEEKALLKTVTDALAANT